MDRGSTNLGRRARWHSLPRLGQPEPAARPLAEPRAGRAGYRRVGGLVNQRRLHGAIDNLPPAEFERQWWEQKEAHVA